MVGVKPLIRCASESEDIMSQLRAGVERGPTL